MLHSETPPPSPGLWNRIPEFRVQHKPCRKSASLRCTARNAFILLVVGRRRNTQHLSNQSGRSVEWHTWILLGREGREENRQNNCNYCFRAQIECSMPQPNTEPTENGNSRRRLWMETPTNDDDTQKLSSRTASGNKASGPNETWRNNLN